VLPGTRMGECFFAAGFSRRPSRANLRRLHSRACHSDDHRCQKGLDLAGAVVLVSCVKSKLSHSVPARALYTSAWFQKVRDIVEASGARWFLISSRYGLVAPNVEIAPYDYTLNTLGVAERRDWATNVLVKLLPEIASEKRVVIFAGHRYREFLVEPLRQRGIEVEADGAPNTR
jgi:hypothetical protein